MSLSRNNGGVFVRNASVLKDTPTSLMGSPRQVVSEQEMQYELNHVDEEEGLSDNIGFPSLPRPKTVLSLSSRGSKKVPRSRSNHQTGSVTTIPAVKVKRDSKQELLYNASSPVSPSSVKVNSIHMSLSKRTTNNRKSVSGISDLFRSKASRSELAGSSEDSTASKSNSSLPITSSGGAGEHLSASMSTNRSRALSKRGAQANASKAGASPDNLQDGQGGTTIKSKKSKKPSKSLTFSFGSNSDRKRRTLGFFGRTEKRGLEKNNTASPSTSPILVNRKVRTLPVSAKSSGLAIHVESDWSGPQVHPKWNDSPKMQYAASYQDVSRPKSPPHKKLRPPPLKSLSSSSYHGSGGGGGGGGDGGGGGVEEEHSPGLDYSPALTSASGMSSWQNSSESLSYSVKSEGYLPTSSSPSSVRQQQPKQTGPSSSPTQSKCERDTTSSSSGPPTRGGRKLSDPSITTPERTTTTTSSSSSSSTSTKLTPQGSSIKKRYTFCVRPSRQSLRPGWKEMRHHVVRFLVETEQSYVESLKLMLKAYYEPLLRPQAAALVDPSLVRDIFYQIPEICSLHEHFLWQLTERVENWDTDERKIGDIFVNTFSKCQLMDIYRKFIGNFMKAKASIEIAKQTKSVFSKFLEQHARDNEGKLTLDDLLIKPVQRIPRYVLFIKDLLKHTDSSHPDHAPLQQALGELTMLAEKVNESERERERVDFHKELLGSVDGLANILSPHSSFIRYDMVTEVKGHVQKKDRFLILFSDVLVCASSRRKSSGFKRSSMLNLNSVFSDGLKYNIKWHFPLTKMSMAQTQSLSFDKRKQNTLEKFLENLQKDEATIQQMLDMSADIHQPHQSLTSNLKDLQAEVRESIFSKKLELEDLPPDCARVDLISYLSGSTPAQCTMVLPSQKIRDSWEEEFLRTKAAADGKAPPTDSIAPPTSPFPVEVNTKLDFLNSIVLQSGRVGMQLTCATEGLPVDCQSSSCLWVCCSDGFGGQVSLLDIKLSSCPKLVANITISSSRITCISAIPQSPPIPPILSPSSQGEGPRILTRTPNISIISTSSSSSTSSFDHMTLSPTLGTVSAVKSESCDKDDDVMFIEGDIELTDSLILTTPLATPSLQSSSGSASLSVGGISRVRSNSVPPYLDVDQVLESSSMRVPSPATGQHNNNATDTTTCNDTSRRVWSALTLRPSALEGVERGSAHCMWLGTEDGQIHLYGAGDNLRSRSNRRTLELNSAVHCIRHYNGCVYAGLANGTIAVLDPSEPLSSPRHSVAVGDGPVRCVVCAMGEMWVGCEGAFYRLDPATSTVQVLTTLPANQLIRDAIVVGSTVWVSVLKSSLLHLYHAPSGHLIASVDCTKPVIEILKSYNPIIRQHKSASLHITALQSSTTHVMAGTSAGIVLAIPLPYIEPSLEPHPLPHPLPHPVPLYQGHVDPVHFLQVVERGGASLVITGGNGCENFSTTGTSKDISETASCLLLWRGAGGGEVRGNSQACPGGGII